MEKIRIHKLAKDLGLPTKELIDMLSKVGFKIDSHMAAVTEQEAQQILEPLLPQLELENGAITTWEELKTGLQAGEYLYPKENAKTAIPVEITGYLHSEVLCSFKVLE